MIIFPARILGLLTQKLTDAPQRLIDVPAHIADKAATLVDAATISAHVVANKVAKSAASTVAPVTTFDPTAVLTAWKAAALHWAGTTSLYGVAAFAAWFAVRWVWQRVRQRQAATWLRWQVTGMTADKLAEMLQASGLKAMSGGSQTLLVNAYHSGAVRRALAGMNVAIVEVK